MGRRDSGIRVPEPERQPTRESRDPGVTFRKLLEDVRSTLSGAMLLRSVQISTYILRRLIRSRRR